MRLYVFHEPDGWTTVGAKIDEPEKLGKIEHTLENVGPIIVEHWLYCRSSAPLRLIFDGYELFVEYLNEKCFAGDAIYIWSFAQVCVDTNTLVQGKCPDDQGRVPARGAY